nr:GatB/YqeY domain-containing protein [uncultured Flavobacterium sp.]
MSLQAQIMDVMKAAMKAKDSVALEALRAIKSEILLAQTSGSGDGVLSAEDEIKLLQKLVKQRKDSASIFAEQGRNDLADPELAQIKVIEQFLPAQLSEQEVEQIVKDIIIEGGFSGIASMGQVMGLASKALAGQADGKTVSTIVKKLLA